MRKYLKKNNHYKFILMIMGMFLVQNTFALNDNTDRNLPKECGLENTEFNSRHLSNSKLLTADWTPNIMNVIVLADDPKKDNFKVGKYVRVEGDKSDSFYSVTATATSADNYYGAHLEASVTVGYNTSTGKKDIIYGGAIKDDGGSMLSMDSAGNINVAYVNGKHSITLKGNTSGEISNVDYNYKGSNTTVHVSKDPTGIIKGTVAYKTAIDPQNSISAGLDVTISPFGVPTINASAAYEYDPQGPGPVFNTTATLSISQDDIGFMLNINLSNLF